MTTPLTKYKLTRKQKRAIANYVYEDITKAEAATTSGINRQNIDRIIAAVTIAATRSGRINFDDIIKNY